MILDAQNMYSDAQAVTADAASTNIIDHSIDRNIGIGEPMVVLVTTDVAAAGGGTLNIKLQCATDAAFTSPVDIASSGAIADTVYVAGYRVIIAVPPTTSFLRYSRLYYDVTTLSSVTLSAFLLPANFIDQSNVYYAIGSYVAP